VPGKRQSIILDGVVDARTHRGLPRVGDRGAGVQVEMAEDLVGLNLAKVEIPAK